MRRRTLHPPREHESVPEGAHLPHRALRAPSPARSVPRMLFDPVGGWFRRLERATSLWLARRVFSHVPGTTRPYGWILGRYLTVAEADVAVPGLHSDLDGISILFVSDVHGGPFLAAADLERAFARLATLCADVVVHGGDLATSRVEDVLAYLPAIGSLRAPSGVFAVMGNHDHYTHDVPRVAALLERNGVRVLDNDAALVSRGRGRLVVAGIDDWNIGRPDLAQTFERAREAGAGAPVVLASHNPDAFFAAAAAGARLVLSGHTHGGQVRFPGLPVLVRMSRFRLDDGRYAVPGCDVVVSRGLGASGLPLRVFCPPEATLVRLVSAP